MSSHIDIIFESLVVEYTVCVDSTPLMLIKKFTRFITWRYCLVCCSENASRCDLYRLDKMESVCNSEFASNPRKS